MTGRVEFPGRFKHCLRARGSSGVVASKEGLELSDDLLVGGGKHEATKLFGCSVLKPTKSPFFSMPRSLVREFQKETKKRQKAVGTFPKMR